MPPCRSARSEQAARLIPQVQLSVLAGLGHLAHEERADLVAEAIMAGAPVHA
jgi:magnesium chelatase accessory protein